MLDTISETTPRTADDASVADQSAKYTPDKYTPELARDPVCLWEDEKRERDAAIAAERASFAERPLTPRWQKALDDVLALRFQIFTARVFHALRDEFDMMDAIQSEDGVDRHGAWLLYHYRGHGGGKPEQHLLPWQMTQARELERVIARAKAERAVYGREINKPPPPRDIKLAATAQLTFEPAMPYVVDGIIPQNGLVTVWGPPKCGKSFWTFDLAMYVALGWDYRGRKVQGGPVVYCAAEGGGGFNNRIVAWRQQFLPDADVREPVPFYLLATPLNLIREHLALIKAIEDQLADIPTLVVIDTLNRTLAGSENRPEDMAAYIAAADAIRVAFGCAVIIIHHCGIDGTRPRGHTSLAGADDAQIAVSRTANGLMRIEVEHMKDGEPAPPFACRLEAVEIGMRVDGKPATSCVVVEAELPAAPLGKRASVTADQQRFLDILADAILDAPEVHEDCQASDRPEYNYRFRYHVRFFPLVICRFFWRSGFANPRQKLARSCLLGKPRARMIRTRLARLEMHHQSKCTGTVERL
jgi:AAA domain-containing protein